MVMVDAEMPDTEMPEGVSEVPESELARLDALESEVAELAGVMNAAQGRLVMLVARALEQGLWAQPGIHSPAQWLAWQLGSSRRNAQRIVGVAQRSGELPETAAALRTGELSLDQAAVVARHVPATHEASAVELARHATVPQLERVLARYAFDPPGSAPAPPAPRGEHRAVSFGATEAGRWTLRADLPIDEGAHVEAALHAAHDRLFHDAEDAAERRAIGWADALLELAAPRTKGRARPCVLVHLEADPVDASRPGVASLHLGSPLPRPLRRLMLCDADVRPVWERGVPVSIGRTSRVVPDRIRRLVEHRDGGCRVPGCGRRRRLQIHHVHHWEDGGSTETGNLLALCAYHHRLHHLGLLGITGNTDLPGGVSFTDRRGERLEPAGRPRAPDHLPEADPYDHPSGEPLDPHWVHLPATP